VGDVARSSSAEEIAPAMVCRPRAALSTLQKQAFLACGWWPSWPSTSSALLTFVRLMATGMCCMLQHLAKAKLEAAFASGQPWQLSNLRS
jgi:hypothetical protein